MSQKEFLEELRTALSGKLSAQAVLENIEYYRNYIEGEVRSGKIRSSGVGDVRRSVDSGKDDLRCAGWYG